MLVALEIAGGVGPLTKRLDRVQQFLLLVNGSVAQLTGPVEVLVHELNHFRIIEQSDDRVVPVLVGLKRRIGFVVFKVTGRLHDLQRIGGRRQYDTDEIVRIEGDRPRQLLQLSRGERGALFNDLVSRLLGFHRCGEEKRSAENRQTEGSRQSQALSRSNELHTLKHL